MKNLILIILLIIPNLVQASQISLYSWTVNDTVTNVKLNNINNTIANAINGGLDNTNANTTSGYRFYQTVGVLPSPGNQGAVYFLTTDNSLNFDTGAAFNKSVSVNSPTTGGIPYYNSAWQNLTIGSNNAVLTSNGTIPNWNLSIGTSANNIVQLDGSAKLPTVDGSQLTNLTGSQITSLLGAWDATKVVSTPYLAATDGYVLVIGDVQGNAVKAWEIDSDSSNPPTTSRVIEESSSGTTEITTSAMTAVKKGDYWEVKYIHGSPSLTIYWIPIGS